MVGMKGLSNKTVHLTADGPAFVCMFLFNLTFIFFLRFQFRRLQLTSALAM